MWILIIAMFHSPMADNDFAALNSVKGFETEAACNKAREKFEQKFQTTRSADNAAICVSSK